MRESKQSEPMPKPSDGWSAGTSTRLPSLDLVRGFEAAARLGSFTEAAAALHLTQSAVSRQVQTLESQLGVPLFERRHRRIVLTEAGEAFYRAAREALRLLGDAAERIRQDAAIRAVTVTCTYGFASLWLVPRLMDFRDRHPDIEVRIAASNRMVDIDRERIEFAVRYCTADLMPRGTVKLFDEEVFPVCSPELPRPGRPLASPADLVHHVLLHHAEDHDWPTGSWTVWLETQQLPSLRPAGSLRFNQYDQLIQAALEGQGVALGVGPLIRRHLLQGRLVALFGGRRFPSPRGYYLMTAGVAATRPDVQAFTGWILAIARREREEAGTG